MSPAAVRRQSIVGAEAAKKQLHPQQQQHKRKEHRTPIDKVRDSAAPAHHHYLTAEMGGEAISLPTSPPSRGSSTGQLGLVEELESRVQELEDELRTTKNKLEYTQMKEAEYKSEVRTALPCFHRAPALRIVRRGEGEGQIHPICMTPTWYLLPHNPVRPPFPSVCFFRLRDCRRS